MNKDEQRIAIHLALGWVARPSNHPDFKRVWFRGEEYKYSIPDYAEDLNAMHEAEKTLFASKPGYFERAWYSELVKAVTGLDPSNDGWGDVDTRQHASVAHATAAERAEAFLRTLNLWHPAPPRTDDL